MIEDEDKSQEEHLIVESHMESSDSGGGGGGKTRNAQKRNQIYQVSKGNVEIGEDEDIEHEQITDQDQDDGLLQTVGSDQLQLVQICVPGEPDNVSWVSLVQW